MPEATRPAHITCAHCGAQKLLGRRGPIPTYCSGGCRNSAKHLRTKQDGRYQAQLQAHRRRTAERRAANASPCPYCTAPMAPPRVKHCGAASCKRAFNAERMRQWNRDYRAESGQWYRAKYADQQREYARRRSALVGSSRKRNPAAAAAGDARRRMRMKRARTAEIFKPIDVHTRDGWTCQLCRLPIDPSIAWPDPMSPSIDHILALSRGGAHTMANVQSAHLGCNSRKGDKLPTESATATRGVAQ